MILRSLVRRRRLAVLVACLCCGCVTMWQARFVVPAKVASLDKGAPFLKCHTRDGSVYVLARWRVVEQARRIEGEGLLYDADRKVVGKGPMSVPFERVALLETNRPESVHARGQFFILALVTGASLAVTALCIAYPKSCFGSCPTFFAHDGDKLSLQAEGFSASVARSLEATDVDALFTARPDANRLELLMTNDALETHAVRRVRLLAAPRPPDGRVLRTADGRFYPARELRPPVSCTSPLGDCLAALGAIDDREYASPTDAGDLARRETVELRFPAPGGRAGLLLRARNSLVNTFLFYQMLAYMGSQAGDWMMKLDRGDPEVRRAAGGMGRLLGDIEVLVLTSRGWVRAGAYGEVGPIARDVQLVELPADLPAGPVQVRLVMARGYWKIDHLAVGRLGAPLTPDALEVQSVLRGRTGTLEDREALARLRDPNAYLVTYPRDAYRLRFELPPSPTGEHELFLESRGFYTEWIRESWLAEENPARVVELLLDPAAALRRLAPDYKRIEKEMERIFWQSRVGR